jgi:hypothetical protein
VVWVCIRPDRFDEKETTEYGELCLTRRDYDRIAEIVDHKFDLKLLYPKRKKFHVSEVVGFMDLLGVHFFETGRRETAEKYYDMLN